jgi:hypothetical protein
MSSSGFSSFDQERNVMPVHDWTKVDAGLFHNFRLGWICSLCDALNKSVLPSEGYALMEPSTRGPRPNDWPMSRLAKYAGKESEAGLYARMADQISVRQGSGQVVAVIEIVSPGNKSSTAAFRTFVEKTSHLIEEGVHALIIDLFPPTSRDPEGIHRAIWDEFDDEAHASPPDKPLTFASYDAGLIKTAYVEPVAVGEILPDMPLFLAPGYYVTVPLEATYRTTWDVFPRALKGLLELSGGPGAR